MANSVWVVEVYREDEDPLTFGPYTERQAARVRDRVTAEVELSSDKYGGLYHPWSFRGAIAYPLTRHDDWMTSEQKSEARAEVWAGNKRYDGNAEL
jgi:hypothetical protein